MASPVAFYFNHLTLVEAVSLLRSGSLTSEQLVQHYIKCTHSHPELCAFAAVDEAGALTAARQADALLASQPPDSGTVRLLEGIPILIKENIHVRGLPNRAGTPALSNFIPTDDAPVVAALRQAGAILYATSHMHELAWGISGYNPLACHTTATTTAIGTRNAYNVDHVACGSSSGNGSALGARLALAAIGTDTGGSVRIPAAANGVCGLRPTYGRYEQTGITPCCLNRDTAGPMALTVADLELLDRVIIPTEAPIVELPALSNIRLGVLQPMMAGLDSDTETVFRAALDKLRACGVQLIDVDAPELAVAMEKVGLACSMYEAKSDLAGYLATYQPSLTVEEVIAKAGSEDVKSLWEDSILADKLSLPDGTTTNLHLAGIQSFTTHRPALVRLYTSLLTTHQLDALTFPTTPTTPPLANHHSSSSATFDITIRNIEPGSLSRCPGLQLPVGVGDVSGLPVGMALDGLPGSDRRLLAVGMALETVLGRLRPPAWLYGSQADGL